MTGRWRANYAGARAHEGAEGQGQLVEISGQVGDLPGSSIDG